VFRAGIGRKLLKELLILLAKENVKCVVANFVSEESVKIAEQVRAL
jgi:hypothetical protein